MANSGHIRSATRPLGGRQRARTCSNYYAAAPERLSGRQIPVAGGVDVTFKEPLGVVGVIVPWNFPLPIAAWGVAPALAAGNTVILKPAEHTPLTAQYLARLAREAGFPPDVFQVLPGKGPVVGARASSTHPGVGKIVFTGSTGVGRQVAELPAAPRGGSRRSPWNSAARAPTSSSPTATSSRPRPPRHTAYSTTPARTAARARGSWSSAACSTGSWNCSNLRSRACGSATRATRRPRWAR